VELFPCIILISTPCAYLSYTTTTLKQGDLVELNARVKMPLQAAMAILWVLSVPPDKLVFTSFPLPDFVCQIFAVFWIVGLTNAINLSDGIDGLSASVSLVCLSMIAFLGQGDFNFLALPLIAAILAFLPFNLSERFKVYLGDGGSLFLGFTMACLLSTTRWGGETLMDPVIGMMLVSYPQVDTIFAIFRRWRAGKRIMDGDRDHIHHRLVNFGIPHWETSFILSSLVALVGLSLIQATRTANSLSPFFLQAPAVLLCLYTVLRISSMWLQQKRRWLTEYLKARYALDWSSLAKLADERGSSVFSLDAFRLIEEFSVNDPGTLDSLMNQIRELKNSSEIPGSGTIVGPHFLQGRFWWQLPNEVTPAFASILDQFFKIQGKALEPLKVQTEAPRSFFQGIEESVKTGQKRVS